MTRNWSPQQTEIFEWFSAAEGNLVVRARAGTGKTTTILQAITHIPGDAKILLCAFNKRIQVELSEKLNDSRAEAKTLHSLGFSFIRRQWRNVRVDGNVEWDRIEEVAGKIPSEMATVIFKAVSLAKGTIPFATEKDLEDMILAQDLEPEESWTSCGWTAKKLAKIVLGVLEVSKEPSDRISFDDMLYIPLVNGFTAAWFDWVIVDEAQDMNYSQLLLAQKACKRNGHIVVVGDDRQAIYGFRGADSGSLDRLKDQYKADELGLTITYRCPKSVVAIAQGLVKDYQAAPEAPQGETRALPLSKLNEAVSVGDAVLSRTNAPLVPVCLSLIRQGVPARIEGKDIGKALAGIIRKLNAKSVPDFLKKLANWAKRRSTRIEAQGARNKETKLQEVADQKDTLVALAEGCVSVNEIIGRCTKMFEDTVNPDGTMSKAPAVVCSSVHKAKGLEWNNVYIIAKTLYCNGARKGIREEENIHYVAVTRAKQTLTMVVE